jgi:hypothetical protein
MASPKLASDKAEFIADVMADAADQYLISYLLLTRFEGCGSGSRWRTASS